MVAKLDFGPRGLSPLVPAEGFKLEAGAVPSGSVFSINRNSSSIFSINADSSITLVDLNTRTTALLGISSASIGFSGTGFVGYYFSGVKRVQIGSSNVTLNSGGYFAFSSDTTASSPDTYLYRDAAGIFAQRNGTTAQTFRVYETYTDSSNGRWVSLESQSVSYRANGTGITNATFYLENAAGTGSLAFRTNSGTRWLIDSNGYLLAGADATYDIGASGANRPRDFFISRHAAIGGYVWPAYVRLAQGGNEVHMYQAGQGVLTLYDQAETSFNRIQLGGITSSYPSIKRNSAGIDFRVADDTAYADITAATVNASGLVPLADNTYDISGANWWRNLFLAGYMTASAGVKLGTSDDTNLTRVGAGVIQLTTTTGSALISPAIINIHLVGQ